MQTGSHRQRGVVLVIALIVLVAMTMAGIALVRSVDTTNIIAGNLAFQQAATNSGDSGVEAAIRWLETSNVGATLYNNDYANGYSATSLPDLTAGQTWDNYWQNTLNPFLGTSRVLSLATNASGNTVSYAIQRMCQQQGQPAEYVNNAAMGCPVSPVVNSSGCSEQGNVQAGCEVVQYYYRITSRIDGPRNTVSYIQAIVAME